MSQIERPIYNEDFKFEDEDCKTIAEYLFNETNETFYKALRRNIIKTYRTFNDIYVPVVDFPVLKVYKSSEFDDALEPYMSVEFTIAYGLAFTQKAMSADVSTFVAMELRRNLKNGSDMGLWQIDTNNKMTTSYEAFISPDNTVYRYASITGNIFTTMVY